MSEPFRDQTEIEKMAEANAMLVPVLASFTATCEQNGYSRSEAMKLTSDYLRSLMSMNKPER